MNLSLVGNLSVSELISLAAHWLTLWLGLSLLSRRPRSSATVLVAAAFLVVSAYLLSVVFLLTPESGRADLFWNRWLGGWEFFAPVLLLHAFLVLTGTRLPRQRLLLALAYATAIAITALSMWGTLIFAYRMPAGAGLNAKGVFVVGRFRVHPGGAGSRHLRARPRSYCFALAAWRRRGAFSTLADDRRQCHASVRRWPDVRQSLRWFAAD